MREGIGFLQEVGEDEGPGVRVPARGMVGSQKVLSREYSHSGKLLLYGNRVEEGYYDVVGMVPWMGEPCW
jgi:hypothetical protein